MNDKAQLIKSIVKAFAYAENGGKPDIEHPKTGKTGEMRSIFQFTPNTWKKDSAKYFGQEVPLTPDSETYVMTNKVKDWIDQGKTVREMASIHNAGAGEPNAYAGTFKNGSSSVGVNKQYGVGFNVPKYANTVLGYSKKFYDQKPQESQNSDPLNQVLSIVKKASSQGNTTQLSQAPQSQAQPIQQTI